MSGRQQIQRSTTIDAATKAQLIQKLMCPNFSCEKEGKALQSFLEVDDRAPTFACREYSVLGCEHYVRSCKIQAPCCGRFFACRKCHDLVCDHDLDRTSVTTVMCMRCQTVQPASRHCSSPACASEPDFAEYYCAACKLYTSLRAGPVYHCAQCGLCRLGAASDFVHCPTCNVCIWKVGIETHHCVPNSHESNCPICFETMCFTKCDAAVAVPACGHPIHKACLDAYVKSGNLRCPVCLKLMADLTERWKAMAQLIRVQPMPPEYAAARAHILCVCCGKRSVAPFHFLGHACGSCGSFNTQVTATEAMPCGGGVAPSGGSCGGDDAAEMDVSSSSDDAK